MLIDGSVKAIIRKSSQAFLSRASPWGSCTTWCTARFVAEKTIPQLLRETNVVVAFSRERQYYPDFDCGPWDIVSVRGAFRRVVGMAMIDGHIKHEAIGDGRVTSGWQGSQGR